MYSPTGSPSSLNVSRPAFDAVTSADIGNQGSVPLNQWILAPFQSWPGSFESTSVEVVVPGSASAQFGRNRSSPLGQRASVIISRPTKTWWLSSPGRRTLAL